jgi:hypothetical protein
MRDLENDVILNNVEFIDLIQCLQINSY